MTDTVVGASGSDPGARGRLEVRERVVERISVFAASEVQGAVPYSKTLHKVTGGALPRAEVAVVAGHVHATVHIALAWPQPAASIAARVRQNVAHQLDAYAGLIVDGVDVAIDAVLPSKPPERRVQ